MRSAGLLLSLAAAAAYAQDGKKLCRAVVQVRTDDRAAERAKELGRDRVAAMGLKIQQPYTMVVTGVFISPKEILTPALHPRADLHVVVTYCDGRVEDATLKGTDPLSNLALIEVPTASETFVPVHVAKVAVGQAMGIAGCPVECREGKAKFLKGVVRSEHVAIGIQDLYGVTGDGCIVLGSAFAIETIEGRPNVGAACVDPEGRLLGLVVGGLEPRLVRDPDQPGRMRVAEMRFAVPAERIERIVEALRKDGRVVRADFGIVLEPADPALFSHFDLPKSATTVTTLTGRPLAEGLSLHDVILSVDGKNYRDAFELEEALADKEPSKPCSFDVLRRGQRTKVTATPGERR